MAPNNDDGAKRRHGPFSRRREKKQAAGTGVGSGAGDHVPSVELPASLRETDDAADEDITAPRRDMNQSLLGLMVAASSTIDHSRSSTDSSDDEGDRDRPIAQTAVLSPRDKKDKKGRGPKHMLKSFHAMSPRAKLRNKLSEASSASDGEVASLKIPVHSPQSAGRDPASPIVHVSAPADDDNVAPVMSRIIEATDELAARPSFDVERVLSEGMPESRPRKVQETPGDQDLQSTRLARKLMDIFNFEQCEPVRAEYPAWFLKNVMLQGYMYITQRHICFYSYLPKKDNDVTRTGFLAKTGRRNPNYRRFWFRLKGDVLAYFPDSSNQYFPHGQVDLRYAVAAKITDKEKDGLHFTVETTYRTYQFKADSPQSANEWVKSLQRVIFRTHNHGDSVKISLPIANILDVEACPMMDFSETCKIRVIDNDETYAIEEYFFSFFGPTAPEAYGTLLELAEDPGNQTTDSEKLVVQADVKETFNSSSKRSSISVDKKKLREKVQATIMPPASPIITSPRASGEFSRASVDISGQGIPQRFDSVGRRSMSESPMSPRRHTGSPTIEAMEKSKSSGSYVQSMEDPSISTLAASSSEDQQSASQILRRSDVFHNPTIRRSDSASRKGGLKGKKALDDVAIPPARASTDGPSPVTKAGDFPLQRASRWAAILNHVPMPMKMSGMLATHSMGYVEKVSGMWRGGHKHYQEPPGFRADPEAGEDPAQTEISNERFRQHFALPEGETLVATYYASLFRVLPLYGKIYISKRSFCFRSLLPGTRTKLILPLTEIETVDKEKGFRLGYSGLCLVIKGHEEVFFEFSQAEIRDDCMVTMLQGLDKLRYLNDTGKIGEAEKEMASMALAERDALHQVSQDAFPSRADVTQPPATLNEPAIFFDDPKASFLNFKPQESLNITCLTIGSRGDVQPYVALCKELLAEGHKPTIATHAEFQDWIESHGIRFAKIEGDPAELMRICIENGTFTLSFLKEAHSKFRGWLDDLLASAWEACQGADVLIESPSAMAGIHVAEALGIPYFRAFTMPWTRTRAYPHAFIVPENKMGGGYNYFTYVMFDNVFWKAMAGQVNRWRNKMLNLPSTSLEKLQPNKVPFLYNFSPSVVPPPLDYSDWVRVTGYWFLSEADKYEPPQDLVDFMSKARADGKKLVYVGFGSIIVPDPEKMTQEVIDAITKADVRCVLSKGWSDRLSGEKDETPLPPEIFQIKSAPHDWLFAQMDAAAHHGGSGSTGASLRAGIPTIIRPFFGDQFFFGSRVEDLGVGIRLSKWGAVSFARALWEATHSQRMIDKAKILGEKIRSETGVQTAVQLIYRDLEYARSLIQTKQARNQGYSGAGTDEQGEDEEEKWTFVGPDGKEDPEAAAVAAAAALDLSASTILGQATKEPVTGSSRSSSPGPQGGSGSGKQSGKHSREPSRGRLAKPKGKGSRLSGVFSGRHSRIGSRAGSRAQSPTAAAAADRESINT